MKKLFALLLLAVSLSPSAFADSFIDLSDIHFDPYFGCGIFPECKQVNDLKNLPASEWDAYLSKHEDKTLSPLHKETNYALLKSATEAASKIANENNAKFVLVTGDILSHHFKQQFEYYTLDFSDDDYYAFVDNTLSYVGMTLHDAFPELPIYMVIGNNDSYHGDYYSEPNGRFFNDSAKIFAPLTGSAPNQAAFMETYVKGGYYAVNPPQTHLRLIILNSNLFSRKGMGPGIEKEALNQISWLHDEYLDAIKHKQHVWLSYHIPSGMDAYYSTKTHNTVPLWHNAFYKLFIHTLDQFGLMTKAVFNGHFHMNTYQILTAPNSDIKIPAIGMPAISPIFGNNPGFKLVMYNPKSGVILNTETFALNRQQNESAWSLLYHFNRTYQAKEKEPSLTKGIESIGKTGMLAEDYKNYFAGGAVRTQPLTKNKRAWKYYWCSIHHSDTKSYQTCLDNFTH